MDGSELNRWQRKRLEQQLKSTQDARVYRRALAILEVSRGQSINHVARSLGVTRQSIHNWIDSYCEAYAVAALEDAPRSGRPSLWTEDSKAVLKTLLDHRPEQFGYFAVSWTVPLLQEQLERSIGTHLSDDTIRRGLRGLGYVWKRGRYVLEPDPELEKKTPDSPPSPQSAASERVAGGG